MNIIMSHVCPRTDFHRAAPVFAGPLAVQLDKLEAEWRVDGHGDHHLPHVARGPLRARPGWGWGWVGRHTACGMRVEAGAGGYMQAGRGVRRPEAGRPGAWAWCVVRFQIAPK